MNWILLTAEETLEQIDRESHSQPVVIFKHSTTCSISRMAKNRLETKKTPENVLFYCLDLLRYRSVSNKVASHFQVHHESPQLLLIINGECVYDESHNGVSMEELEEQVSNLVLNVYQK